MAVATKSSDNNARLCVQRLEEIAVQLERGIGDTSMPRDIRMAAEMIRSLQRRLKQSRQINSDLTGDLRELRKEQVA